MGQRNVGSLIMFLGGYQCDELVIMLKLSKFMLCTNYIPYGQQL